VCDLEERFDHRFRSLEERLDLALNLYLEASRGMVSRLVHASNAQDKGKQLDGEVIRGESSRTSLGIGPLSAVHLKRNVELNTKNEDSYQGRYQRGQSALDNEGKFPLPKNPKIDIPIFKGEGYVLNWLYQIKHDFNIYDTPLENMVEFCVFYLQGEALLWWWWLEKQKGED